MANLLSGSCRRRASAVGHGQMGEEALEKVMVDFVAHKYDVLLATTIIENGLDIPNANTIIINRADRYGLSQLYQLRGRVGRSDRRAYAYLLIPPEQTRCPGWREAAGGDQGVQRPRQRLPRGGARPRDPRRRQPARRRAERPHRGIGFDMYMKLLEETIRELKGEDLEDDVRHVNLRSTCGSTRTTSPT
jgi:transcription-repair coupling factor (superfamily II helicase)